MTWLEFGFIARWINPIPRKIHHSCVVVDYTRKLSRTDLKSNSQRLRLKRNALFPVSHNKIVDCSKKAIEILMAEHRYPLNRLDTMPARNGLSSSTCHPTFCFFSLQYLQWAIWIIDTSFQLQMAASESSCSYDSWLCGREHRQAHWFFLLLQLTNN